MSRTPIAAAHGVTTLTDGCGYLHSTFGPGCPYCMTAVGGAVAQVAAVRAELTAAGFTAAERTAFLLAWDKPSADLTPAEFALLDVHDGQGRAS